MANIINCLLLYFIIIVAYCFPFVSVFPNFGYFGLGGHSWLLLQSQVWFFIVLSLSTLLIDSLLISHILHKTFKQVFTIYCVVHESQLQRINSMAAYNILFEVNLWRLSNYCVETVFNQQFHHIEFSLEGVAARWLLWLISRPNTIDGLPVAFRRRHRHNYAMELESQIQHISFTRG